MAVAYVAGCSPHPAHIAPTPRLYKVHAPQPIPACSSRAAVVPFMQIVPRSLVVHVDHAPQLLTACGWHPVAGSCMWFAPHSCVLTLFAPRSWVSQAVCAPQPGLAGSLCPATGSHTRFAPRNSVLTQLVPRSWHPSRGLCLAVGVPHAVRTPQPTYHTWFAPHSGLPRPIRSSHP